MCIYGLSSDGQSDTGCGHMDSYHAPKISSPASLKQFDCHQERKQTDMGFFVTLHTLYNTLQSCGRKAGRNAKGRCTPMDVSLFFLFFGTSERELVVASRIQGRLVIKTY